MNLDILNQVKLYLNSFINIAGIFGNIITIIIFSRKKFQNTIFSTYFRILSLFSMLTLFIRIHETLKSNFGFKLIDESLIICKLVKYFSYFLPSINPWMFVTISIDRYLSIAKPTKILSRKKISFQIICSIGLIITCSLVYTPIIWETDMKNKNMTNQSCGSEPYNTLFNTTYLILLPFALMMIFTILTLVSLFKSRRRNQSSSTIKSKDIKFAITSISLNLLFFIFGFPIGLYFIITDKIESNYPILVFTELFYINYANLFYISIIFNSIFRKELIVFLIDLKRKIYI